MFGNKGISFTLEAIIAGFIIVSSLLFLFRPLAMETYDVGVSDRGYNCLKYLDESGLLREDAMDDNYTNMENNLQDCMAGLNYTVQICRVSCTGTGGSTETIILQNPDTENLEDTSINPDNPDTNYGNDTKLNWSAIDTTVKAYLKFSLSEVPGGANITDSQLGLYSYGFCVPNTLHIYELDNQTWWEGNGTGGPTFNNPIIGIGIELDNLAMSDLGYQVFNVTSWVKNQFDNNKENVSFMHNTSTGGCTSHYYSKENPSSDKPYLNITYSLSSVIPENQTVIVSNYFIAGDVSSDPLKVKLSMWLK